MAHSEPSQPAPVRKTRQQQNTQNTKNEWMAFRYSIHSECHKTFFYISLLWPATYKNDMKRHQRRRIFIYTARSAFCTRWNIGTNTNDKKIWKRQLFLTWIRFFQFFRETSFQRWISWFSSALCAIHFGIRPRRMMEKNSANQVREVFSFVFKRKSLMRWARTQNRFEALLFSFKPCNKLCTHKF